VGKLCFAHRRHWSEWTGDSTERVDTRVLQIIYRVERDDLPLFVGQQLDVFIEAPPRQGSGEM